VGFSTPGPPSWAERARTTVTAAASTTVRWDGGQADLFGSHRARPGGAVSLTLDPSGLLARAVDEHPARALPIRMDFTEVCPITVRDRVRATVQLHGVLGQPSGPATGRLDVSSVSISQDGVRHDIDLHDYRTAAPDPLHPIAADHVQHLQAHHAEAVTLLSRLCGRAALSGAIRVVPIGLDRTGLLLRVERLREHSDVRLAFRRSVTGSASLADELTYLIIKARTHRPCHHA
jgi:hypothetical protein